MKTYLIINGRFRMPDGKERGPGETIDLDDDVAKANAHQVQLHADEAEPAANSGAPEVLPATSGDTPQA